MSDETVRELALTRAREPERIAEAAAVRRRPDVGLGEGRTFIVAADHSARGMVGAGRHPGAMADRGDLLERLCLALSRPGVTGVLGTPDILEDLLLLGASASTSRTRRRPPPARRARMRSASWRGGGWSRWSSRSWRAPSTGGSSTSSRPTPP